MVFSSDLIGFHGYFFDLIRNHIFLLNFIGFHGTLLGLNRMSWYFTWISKDSKVFYLD